MEKFFKCPYCWEKISMLLDESVESQSFIEDCEVCCNPIQITYAMAESREDSEGELGSEPRDDEDENSVLSSFSCEKTQ